MKRAILIIVLLTAAAAMGQSSLKAQQTCYTQAQKAARRNPRVINRYGVRIHLYTVTNHYDAGTGTCWLKEAGSGELNGEKEPLTYEVVFNPFELDNNPAEYLGSDSAAVMCKVDGEYCIGLFKFEQLTKQRYGF